MKRRSFKRIDAEAFRTARLQAALSRREAAELLFVDERTVRNWEAGRNAVPYAAYKLLKVLSGYALPGKAWEGWMLYGGVLVSPEGRDFGPSDLSWWGLTVAMARAWKKRYGASTRDSGPASGVTASPPPFPAEHAGPPTGPARAGKDEGGRRGRAAPPAKPLVLSIGHSSHPKADQGVTDAA